MQKKKLVLHQETVRYLTAQDATENRIHRITTHTVACTVCHTC
jgi:hypothetical protein